MDQRLRQLREQALRLLGGFTTGQKAVLGLAVVGVLVGGLFFSSWAAKPSYAALYTNLDSADAASITEQLTSEGVSYKLADGGTTVMVPQNKLYDLRLDLSSKGLPTGGDEGFKLLDKQGITASEFRQRVDYQRALAGELNKTIEAMDVVSSAAVQLVIPEQDLFSQDEVRSTASVLVTPRSGKTLSATQVESIVHLVASSVQGLTPDNVTVTDNAGNLLSAAGPEGQAALQGDRRAQQTAAFEDRVAQKVQKQLESVLGTGNAHVTVAAELDFDKRQTTSEQFTAGPEIARSQSDETFTGTSPQVGGPLGQTGTPVQTTADNQNYTKNETNSQTAPNKTTEVTDSAPGAIKRLAVSVFVNQDNQAALPVAQIQQQVSAAAGLDAARGDTVEVSLAKFDTSAADAAAQAAKDAEAAARRGDLLETARTVGTLLIVGLGLLIGYRRLRGGRVEETIPLEQLALEAGTGGTMTAIDDGGYDELYELTEEELMELDPAEAAAMAGARGPMVAIEGGEGPAAVLRTRRQATQLDRLPGMEEREAQHADIADLIDRQPDDVAQLLRSWMAEMRRSR